ncbi:hypothetical protein ACFC6U_03140 [Kitasatospora purpeofusca]|uniref:hypothetical protein n=1 Tax=Kitasatospora purpeofusca TaxID=67352 RepID=UPI0035E3969E
MTSFHPPSAPQAPSAVRAEGQGPGSNGDRAGAVLLRARRAGEECARWVRGLADSQDHDVHRSCLETTAAAIEEASGRVLAAGGSGYLPDDLAHALGAGMLGPAADGSVPHLVPGERLALAAACAVAAAMPVCFSSNPIWNREIAVLAEDLQAATTAGQLATRTAAAATCEPRTFPLLGGAFPDPLDGLAWRGVTARATEAFEIALHYQDGTGPKACAEALLNALHAASPGIVAAALVRVADDPALGLDADQWEYLHNLAGTIDLDTLEDLTGANGPGTTDGP